MLDSKVAEWYNHRRSGRIIGGIFTQAILQIERRITCRVRVTFFKRCPLIIAISIFAPGSKNLEFDSGLRLISLPNI